MPVLMSDMVTQVDLLLFVGLGFVVKVGSLFVVIDLCHTERETLSNLLKRILLMYIPFIICILFYLLFSVIITM